MAVLLQLFSAGVEGLSTNDMSLHGLQTVYSTSKMGKNGFGWKLEQGGTRDNKKISTNSIQIWMETHYCTKVCSNR